MFLMRIFFYRNQVDSYKSKINFSLYQWISRNSQLTIENFANNSEKSEICRVYLFEEI